MHTRRWEHNIKMNNTEMTGCQLNASNLRRYLVTEYSEYSNELSSFIKREFIYQ
jgi:hypothetical protein